MARPVYLSVALAVVLAGCSPPPPTGSSPAATPPSPAPARAPAAERPDKAGRLPWQARYGMPEALDPATVEFVAPATGEQFRKADRAARKLAGAHWAVRPGPTYRYVSWNSSSSGGYSEKYSATWAVSEPPPRRPAEPRPPRRVVDVAVLRAAEGLRFRLAHRASRRGDGACWSTSRRPTGPSASTKFSA